MKDRFKFRVAEFSDKDHFIQFSYYEIGDSIYGTLCGHNSDPQMCTGFKDKNGRLIYEGDIVKINDEAIDEIIFDVGCFVLKNIICRYEAAYWNTKNFEVVGNIYENEELIEEIRNQNKNKEITFDINGVKFTSKDLVEAYTNNNPII